jgi:hypothetical protein
MAAGAANGSNAGPSWSQGVHFSSQRLAGGYYLVDVQRCTCIDFTRRQLACKHVMADRLHVALVKGSHPRCRVFQAHVNGSGEAICPQARRGTANRANHSARATAADV